MSRHSLAGMLEGKDRMAWRRGNYHRDCLLQEGCCDWLLLARLARSDKHIFKKKTYPGSAEPSRVLSVQGSMLAKGLRAVVEGRVLRVAV